MADARETIETLFTVGIKSADPLNCVPAHLPPAPKGRTLILGAGKAAARMAEAVEAHWQGAFDGLVITRHGHGANCTKIEVVEARHPVPEASGAEAARRTLSLAEELGPDDLLIFLASGGGSALLEVPANGLDLSALQSINRQLLHSGAPITEMNCVRKHLSLVKGGRLAAAAHPARVVTIAISDVPGDDPSVIASGPTAPDPTTRQQALDIVRRYNIDLPAAACNWLDDPASETPKSDDRIFEATAIHIASRPQDMVRTVSSEAQRLGFEVLDLGAEIEGEASQIGAAFAAMACSLADARNAKAPPLLIVSGGETTVTVRNPEGRGGRNCAFLLGFGMELGDRNDIAALAADTDGIDGSQDNAGAIFDARTLAKADALGLDGKDMLANDLSYDFFEATDDLIMTGPTRTNVNDLRLILIQKH